MYSKLQQVKNELEDLRKVHARDQEELEIAQMEVESFFDFILIFNHDCVLQMTRELKLKMLIIDNFIPPEDKLKLEKKIRMNEETEEYEFTPLSGSQRLDLVLF